MWLWGSIIESRAMPGTLHASGATIDLKRFARESWLHGRLEELRGRTVMLAVRDQLSAALALIELDGVARRLVLCPPLLSDRYITAAAHDAEADAWVGDQAAAVPNGFAIDLTLARSPQLLGEGQSRRASHVTEWILLTSATTGAPKLVQHSLASLTSAFAHQRAAPEPVVWSTFYDIRRYGGLQIFLRGLFCGAMVLSSPDESVVDFMARAGRAGVTHISGTASHWRAALISGATSLMAPRYVRLSGEIADQAILDALHVSFPEAKVAHAFATTEAGVAFEVEDGLAGFPASVAKAPTGSVEIRIEDGTLRVRSPGVAAGYLGVNIANLCGADGFVDTGDRVELRDGRYYFMGRRGGIINVGGQKVHPEEVEAVINAHPLVRMSLVKARRNPITGAVVVAEVVIAETDRDSTARPDDDVLAQQIIKHCRTTLPAHKVPAIVRIVSSLEVSAAGKLVRPNA